MSKMISHERAVSFLTTLLQSRALSRSKQDILKNMYLHGSTIEHGRGRYINTIFAVGMETFEQYCAMSRDCYDGLHPISHHFEFGALWDNPASSPKEQRTICAFQMIGLNIKEFLLTDEAGGMLLKNLDAICLPEGWCDRTSDVRRDLHEKLKKSGDTTFLIHAIRSKLEITA